jgi:3-methyladenine DNA glycosylase/8-oxoguanine DNA glycosylase
MIINLTIDDKEVLFDTSLSWMYWYKAQFGEDPMTMIKPLLNVIGKKPESEDSENQVDLLNNPLEIFDFLPLQKVLNIAWSLAANNDEKVLKTPPLKWFHQFERFPLDDVFMVLIPAIVQSMVSEKKFSTLKKLVKESLGDQLSMISTESESQPTTSDSDGTTSE